MNGRFQHFVLLPCMHRGDADLLDFLVDSGVYASSTADQMLAGEQGCQKLTYEPFSCLKLL